MAGDLPDGWEHTETNSGYTKLVKRGAVTVPKRRAGDGFDRSAVVVLTDARAGVTSGPGARRTWETDDPEAVATALVDVIEAWIDEGGDPYGGSGLNDRLDAAAKDASIATGLVS